MRKERSFYRYHEISRNLYDRTRVEFKRSLSMRYIDGNVWANQVHFPVFLPCKNNWNFFDIHSVIRTPKQDFMPNFSQIDGMKWPTKVRRLQTIALNSPQNVSFTKANRMPTSFLLTLTTVKFILEFLG